MVAPSAISVPSGRTLPQCWGHRGASAAYPENTLASFEAAIQDGAEGIESDVHVSLDDVVVMFHDPDLSRTTNSNGQIKERNWYGENGMEHVRTVKEPHQAIPTFAETVALLMRPENRHVKFNVDVKVQNDPDRLFSLMHQIISAQPEWETVLAPRLLLGLWHPRFLAFAKARMPYCDRSYLGNSPDLARKYFWDDCGTMSMSFPSMAGKDGEGFRRDCKKAGKKLMIWTVNKPEQMMEASRWGVDVIITDVTQTWLEMRRNLSTDYEKIGGRYGRVFLWTTLRYYTPYQQGMEFLARRYLESIAGPFSSTDTEPPSATPATIQSAA
ncbi:glycerophosphodiester phosphodiesterase [Moniliophthora roreri MCA 2997]|uniref:Glycerophosphodiester phosphodiesterase n=1 Tax=Moniliophthora roreri (strain MCA 2997) TaxID=1381753 RepID=V2XAC0_MONRO|nr:glycerophosphodiester phosphodiesterase [Moniliophthora roreri MCA 2997]